MSFSPIFKQNAKSPGSKRLLADGNGLPLSVIHKAQCAVCPLNHSSAKLRHPHMPAYGPAHPVIYILGEAPGKEEDERGRPFVGPAGRCLRLYIPDAFGDKIRWNNVIRTRPPNNRDPAPIEVEACRPSIIADIEQSQPRAIFGFGNVALQWTIGHTGISKWRGRRTPVQVGRHPAWYFPFMHPSALLRVRQWEPRRKDDYPSDQELAFAFDLRRAFQSLDKLPTPIVHTAALAGANIQCITGHKSGDFNRLVAFLEKARASLEPQGFDIETNYKRPYFADAKILTAAIALADENVSFALDHRDAGWTPRERKALDSYFRDYLYEARGTRAVHHLAFELEWLGYKYGKDMIRSADWDDTMSQAWILDERNRMGGEPDPMSLAFLTQLYFGLNIKTLSPIDTDNLDNAPLDQVLRYNSIDAKYHRLTYLEQHKRLTTDKLQQQYIEHRRRIPTMVLTQLKGIPVDFEVVRALEVDYQDKMDDLAEVIAGCRLVKKFKARTGKSFRPSAPQDIKTLLSMAGVIVNTAEAHEVQKLDDPVTGPLSEWRHLAKAHSTYIKPMLPASKNIYYDGLLHCIISTCNTVTWRTSAEGPNVQNYPKRDDAHKNTRQPVRLRNHKVVSFDYAQIQARNVAMESGDKALTQAFWERYDIHRDWMFRIANQCPGWATGSLNNPDVVKVFRQESKNKFVFPSLFGAGANNVSNGLGIPLTDAEALHEEFWAMFPGVQGWHRRQRESLYKRGYVTGLTGIRRRAPVEHNQIINAPIQADEAAIVCDAMNRLSEWDHDLLQASMEIHDDLTFIWHADDVDKYAEQVLSIMLYPSFTWAQVVPTVVEMSVGDDWAKLKSAGEYSSDSWSS